MSHFSTRKIVQQAAELFAHSDKPPKIANGKPFVRGTQVPVADIMSALAGGMQIDKIARKFGISNEYVRAAIGYAARIVSQIAI